MGVNLSLTLIGDYFPVEKQS